MCRVPLRAPERAEHGARDTPGQVSSEDRKGETSEGRGQGIGAISHTGYSTRVSCQAPPARDDLSLLRTRAFAGKTFTRWSASPRSRRTCRSCLLRARRLEARDPGVRPARRVPALHQAVVHVRPPGRIRARRVRRGVAGTRGADPERAGRHQRRRRAGDAERRERERRGPARGRGARARPASAAPGGVRQAGGTVRPLRRCRYVPRRLSLFSSAAPRASVVFPAPETRGNARAGADATSRAPPRLRRSAHRRACRPSPERSLTISPPRPPAFPGTHRADSPQWRRGPASKPMLCNACGTRYRRTNTLGPSTPAHRAGAVVVPKKRSPPESPSSLNPAKKRCADEGLRDPFGTVGTGVRA